MARSVSLHFVSEYGAQHGGARTYWLEVARATTCFAMTPHFSLAEENQGVMAGRLRLSCRLRIDKPYSGSNDQTCDQLFERTAQVEARWLTCTREIC
jgi:hypothetical protein